MKDFVASDGRCVREKTQAEADAYFASTPQDKTWRVTQHAGGTPVLIGGVATFVAPDGSKYQAKNLSEAIAQNWNAARKSGTRQSAVALGRPALAFDEASSAQAFAARDKIYKGSGTSVEDVMSKTAEYHRLVADASAHR